MLTAAARRSISIQRTTSTSTSAYNIHKMVKLNLQTCITATSAIAAFSTFHAPLHVQAFAPMSMSMSMHQHRANVAPNNHFRSSTHLAASAVDEAPIFSDEQPPFTPSAASASSSASSKIVATADATSFTASPNGLSGIMAIKLRQEDHVALTAEQKEKADIVNAANQAIKKSMQGEDFIGKAVVFHNGRKGTIIAQRPPMCFVLCEFGEWDEQVNENEVQEEAISILGMRSTVAVSASLFGTIVDCYGNPMDGSEGSTSKANDAVDRAIFAPIPKVSDIALINSPVLFGTAMVDALAPIGKGQNMLIIGQDTGTGVGQRDLVIGAVKTQVQQTNGAKCVYAITSQKKSVRDNVIQQLKDAGVLDDIVVVAARDLGEKEMDSMDATAAAEAITVAATACSIGEALALAGGEDTLVIVDDIDQHKAFWDWTTRVLVDVYGVDAVVRDDLSGGASSEMRGFYSSLIQRAARFNKKNGGGSMTLTLLTNLKGQFGDVDGGDTSVFSPDEFAESSEKIKQRIAILVNKNIPLTHENLRKIQIPLPDASESEKQRRIALQHSDDLISMSDGQIWLDETLYANGQRPAMDPQRSVTRIGIGADTTSRADAPAMRGLAGGLRFDFAQANSLEGAGANSGADKQILKKQAYLLAMHQEGAEVRTLSENCVVLLAASLGVFGETLRQGGTAGTTLGQDTIKELIHHVKTSAPDAMAEIDESLDLSESVRKELETIIKVHFS